MRQLPKSESSKAAQPFRLDSSRMDVPLASAGRKGEI